MILQIVRASLPTETFQIICNLRGSKVPNTSWRFGRNIRYYKQLLVWSANAQQISTPETTTLWIYSEALKKGLLTADQASSIIRTISLMHVSDIPDELVRQCVQETRQFVAGLL